MLKESFANSDVLEFYQSLPFNQRSSLEEEIKSIRNRRIEGIYSGITGLLGPKVSVLEVGCGVGWLSNTINFLYKAPVVGIDFNPVAIKMAQDVAKEMGLSTHFSVEDLFLYNPPDLFDVVLSFGVLHHTNNCLYAVEKICKEFVHPGGHVVIGLYHKYGRQPFLQHFNYMKRQGASEEEMFARYKQLHARLKDETHLLSWFRDQVLHPHETQHTLEEILPVLEGSHMKLTATSINGFHPFASCKNLIEEEKNYAVIAEKKLQNNEYFSGFFIFVAQRIS